MKKVFLLFTSITFTLLSILFFIVHSFFPDYSFISLECGNLLMFILTVLAYILVNPKIGSRPQKFINGILSASILKMSVCMVSFLTFVLLNRENLHKPTIFILLGIYIVYTAIETRLLIKMNSITKK